MLLMDYINMQAKVIYKCTRPASAGLPNCSVLARMSMPYDVHVHDWAAKYD